MVCVVVQQWQRAFGTFAQRDQLSVLVKSDRVIVRPYVHKRHLDKTCFRHGRVPLPRHKVFRVFTRLDHLETDAHHSQGAEVPLFPALARQLGGLVEHRLAGDLALLFPDVLDESDRLPPVVHIEKYRITLVLRYVHALGQHTVAVAVQRVVCQSYSAHCLWSVVMIRCGRRLRRCTVPLPSAAVQPSARAVGRSAVGSAGARCPWHRPRCKIGHTFRPLQKSVQPLHTSMQRLHTFFARGALFRNFVLFFGIRPCACRRSTYHYHD